jgi:hypothetical protein
VERRPTRPVNRHQRSEADSVRGQNVAVRTFAAKTSGSAALRTLRFLPSSPRDTCRKLRLNARELGSSAVGFTGSVRMREEPSMAAALPPGITSFQDDDCGFFAWLEGNPDGYFINSERNPGPGYLVLHRASCSHFTGNVALHWTKDYVKFCSPARRDLEEWAAGAVGGEATLCHTCFG